MIWFTADTHFDHSNIIKYCDRQFSCVEDMNDEIITRINKYVAKNDTLYHLGDIAFSKRYKWVDKSREFLDRISCKDIRIIWGNHDSANSIDKYNRKLSHYFNTKYVDEIKINGQLIVLHHYAMAIWNKSHRNSWHLYGHSHSNAEKYMDEHFPNRKSMDVGIDNIYKLFGEYRPISFSEVKEIMDTKTGCVIDHHKGK